VSQVVSPAFSFFSTLFFFLQAGFSPESGPFFSPLPSIRGLSFSLLETRSSLPFRAGIRRLCPLRFSPSPPFPACPIWCRKEAPLDLLCFLIGPSLRRIRTSQRDLFPPPLIAFGAALNFPRPPDTCGRRSFPTPGTLLSPPTATKVKGPSWPPTFPTERRLYRFFSLPPSPEAWTLPGLCFVPHQRFLCTLLPFLRLFFLALQKGQGLGFSPFFSTDVAKTFVSGFPLFFFVFSVLFCMFL